MRPHPGHRQRGAALAFVLGLIVIVGILVGLTWRRIHSNNAIAAMNQGDAQARLLALSGLEYALAKIGPPGPEQDLGYASEDLEYRLDDSTHTFALSVRTHGLFARARSVGKTALPRPGRSRSYAALIGQSLDLGKLPVLALLNHEGNLVLAGTAQVTGPVLLWRGDVRKATDYNVRWTGKTAHTGPLWDSTAAAWKSVPVDFRRADAWMKAQAEMSAARDFSKDGDYDSGMVRDLFLPDSALIRDSVLIDTRILARRVLRIGAGTRLSGCKLMADRILIEGDAQLERSLVFAGRTLRIDGGRIQGGQFLAGDTVHIESVQSLQGYPLFYAQGRMSNRGKPDSAMVGSLEVEKVSGEGLFLSACKDHPQYDQEVRLAIGPDAHLTGLLFTPCYAGMEGSLDGSLICHNLKFAYKGTIWLGHLKDARLRAALKGAVVPAPLLFPGFPPEAFAGRGP